MAFLAAAFVFPSVNGSLARWQIALLALLSCAMLGGLLLAYFGKEEANYFTKTEFRDRGPSASELLQKDRWC